MASPDHPELMKQLSLICDFRDVLINSLQGRRALKHLRERFHVESSTAVIDLAGQPLKLVDRDTQLFLEGQRSVVLYMMALADADTSKLEEEYSSKEKEAAAVKQEIDDIGV